MMDENNKLDQLRQQGWEEMSSLLDKHMPEDKKPIIGWYWLAGAAALVLALAIPFTLLMNGDSFEHIPQLDQKLAKPSNQENVPQTKGESVVNSLASRSPENNIAAKSNGPDAEAGSAGSIDLADRQSLETRNETIRSYGKTPAEVQSKRVGDTPEERDSHGMMEVSAFSIHDQGIANLDRRTILVNGTREFYLQFVNSEHKKVVVPELSGKIFASVFSEMMWSVSDRFGFVNAGPDVKYTFGKWALGLSGGLAMPLPRQKAFYASNLPFSNQYNFNKQYESMVQDGSFSNSSGSIYYESYSMKPGFIVSLSAQRQLTNHWGVGVDVGRIGFRYDFTQKAKPNLNIAANTDLSNLQNNLWYGGLSLHYRIAPHWVVHGGVKMINLFHASDVGVLPALKVEYGF